MKVDDEEKTCARSVSFSPPDITETEIYEVVDTLKSGWITTGPKTKKLEHLIAEKCKTSRAVCLNSNTACAEITLRILGIGPGDEVIVPAYTYSASASVVEHVGAKLILVDCEKNKFTMDYNQLEKAITNKTKVIIPVDLFGIPADYDRIYEIVERKKHLFHPTQNKPDGQEMDTKRWGEKIQKAIGRIIVMADGAHSFGAFYKKRPVGSVADFTNFSFHAVKNLTTAEGGAVTWNTLSGIDDDELYHLYMLYSLHGQSKDALSKSKDGAWEYDIVEPWFKCNMTDVHAAIGLGQIQRYDDILARRREMISKFDIAFAKLPIESVEHYSNEFQSSGHLYIVRLFDAKGEPIESKIRNNFIVKMAKLGVATNVHYKPLPMHTAYKKLGFNIKEYPHAYEQFQNEVTLPLHTCLTNEDLEYVIKCVKKVLSELIKCED